MDQHDLLVDNNEAVACVEQKTGAAFTSPEVAFFWRLETGVTFQKTGVVYAIPCHPCAHPCNEVYTVSSVQDECQLWSKE